MVKIQLCACGCEEIPKFDNHYRQNKYVEGHNKGEFHANFKGGRVRHSNGYIMILQPDHPYCNGKGYVMEHRLVMEEYLGRYLTKKEDVHHLNGIKTDNGIENLQIVSKSEHGKITHPIIDKSNRSCFKCGTKTTGFNKYRNNEPVWLAHPLTKLKWICKSCYGKIYRGLK